jgi:hypothetical protein
LVALARDFEQQDASSRRSVERFSAAWHRDSDLAGRQLADLWAGAICFPSDDQGARLAEIDLRIADTLPGSRTN